MKKKLYTSECEVCKKRFEHNADYRASSFNWQHFIGTHKIMCFVCENKLETLLSVFIENHKKVWNNVKRWKF